MVRRDGACVQPRFNAFEAGLDPIQNGRAAALEMLPQFPSQEHQLDAGLE